MWTDILFREKRVRQIHKYSLNLLSQLSKNMQTIISLGNIARRFHSSPCVLKWIIFAIYVQACQRWSSNTHLSWITFTRWRLRMKYFIPVTLFALMKMFWCQTCVQQTSSPDFDDLLVHEHLLWTELGLEGTECASRCFLDPRCHSVQFQRSTGGCTGHATAFANSTKMYPPPTDAPGQRLHLMSRGRYTNLLSDMTSCCSFNNDLQDRPFDVLVLVS